MKINLDKKTIEEMIEKSYKQIDYLNSEISIKRKKIRNKINDELNNKVIDNNEIVIKNDSIYNKIILENKSFLENRIHMLQRDKQRLSMIKGDSTIPNKIKEINRLISVYEEDYQIMNESPDEYFKGHMYENWELFVTEPKIKKHILCLSKELYDLTNKRKKILSTIKLLEESNEKNTAINIKYLKLILETK